MSVLREAIEAMLAALRPGLQRDGGDLELVALSDDGVVTVRVLGSCAGCPVSLLTIQACLENALREKLPDVSRVVAVR